jgi:biotin-dependent carboxylase-like uncharacterized protein
MTGLRFIDCGPATSLQDLGRPGLARLGLPRSGAMDRRALAVANGLVGNAPAEAAIELAMLGARLRAEGGPVRLALAGAACDIAVDGVRIDGHASFVLEAGSNVSIGRARNGVYAMLAAAGGFAVDPVLASRSLYARAGIGGYGGRAFAAGDVLPLRAPMRRRAAEIATDPVGLDEGISVRVLLGPHADSFTDAALHVLLDAHFTVTPQCDRMAYRLRGPAIERAASTDMVSQGVMPGAIQVPPDGQPLVLMADCQTVGGYPRIATVVSADLGVLAQRRPGQSVRFAAVDVGEAQRIAREARSRQLRVRPCRQPGPEPHEHQHHHRLLRVADAAVNALDAATW